jgi:hypothetical protein
MLNINRRTGKLLQQYFHQKSAWKYQISPMLRALQSRELVHKITIPQLEPSTPFQRVELYPCDPFATEINEAWCAYRLSQLPLINSLFSPTSTINFQTPVPHKTEVHSLEFEVEEFQLDDARSVTSEKLEEEDTFDLTSEFSSPF